MANVSQSTESRKRSAKEAKMYDEDEYGSSQSEEIKIKHFPRSFAVLFRNMRFEMQINADMTLSEFKNKIKRYASKALQHFEASDIDNEHLRLQSGHSWLKGEDEEEMGVFFHFNSAGLEQVEVTIEEAIGVTLRTPNSSWLHGIFVFPSDSIECIYFKAFKVDKEHTGNPNYWFHIYCKRLGAAPLEKNQTVKEVLADGDRLEMRYDLTRAAPAATMRVFVRAMTGQVCTIDTLAGGQETVQNFKWMVGCHSGISLGVMRIIASGRQLSDGQILSNYNIRNESTVYALVRRRGS